MVKLLLKSFDNLPMSPLATATNINPVMPVGNQCTRKWDLKKSIYESIFFINMNFILRIWSDKYLRYLCLNPRRCSRSARLAAASLGSVCDLPPGGCAARRLPGCGRTLRQLLVQICSPHVASIGSLRLPHLCSAAGTSQGELKHFFNLYLIRLSH